MLFLYDIVFYYSHQSLGEELSDTTLGGVSLEGATMGAAAASIF